VVKAVDGVDFEVYQGETLGIVGESGCGKSVTAFSILRLLDYPGKTIGGEVIFKGENLLKKTEDEMREIRGKEIAMIFQEPMTALNPVLTVGFQISEALLMHFKISKGEAKKKSSRITKKSRDTYTRTEGKRISSSVKWWNEAKSDDSYGNVL